MSNLPTQHSGRSSGQDASRPPGRQIADSLNLIRQNQLAPFDRMDKFRAEHPYWTKGLFEIEALPSQAVRTQEAREHALTSTRDRIAALPPGDQAVSLRDELRDAASEAYAPNPTRLIVASMIDAFPTARPHSPAAYVESLVHELKASGYAPAVIAKACNEIIRSATFPPAVAEVLARCEEVSKNLTATVRLLDMLVEGRPVLESNVAMLENLGDLPSQAEQRAAIAETLRAMGGLGATAGRGLHEARQ